VGEVPEVLVLAVAGRAADLKRDIVRFCVVNLFVAGLNRPFPPRGDDFHARREVLDGQLKTHLVIALAGAAVGNRVRAFLEGDLRETLGDHGTRRRRAEQVVFVHRARLHGGDDVFVHVLVGQIFNIELGSAGFERFLLQAFQLAAALTDVARDRDDFASGVVFLEPGDDDGCVESAGISQYDLLNAGHMYAPPNSELHIY